MISSAFDRIKQLTGKMTISDGNSTQKPLRNIGGDGEDIPLDTSAGYVRFCEACRSGDLKTCHELIADGVNINAKDMFDYTPLILASLCGQYEVVRLLLESGATCDRKTYQGERCLHNALNGRIYRLLLSYDFTKATNPLQPYAIYLSKLLTREDLPTTDIVLSLANDRDDRPSYRLHKFILAARSPYLRANMTPDMTHLELPIDVPSSSLLAVVRYFYQGEVFRGMSLYENNGKEKTEVLLGIEKLAGKLHIAEIFTLMNTPHTMRDARRRALAETTRNSDMMDTWFQENVLKNKVIVDTNTVDSVVWDKNNKVYADVMLRADEDIQDSEEGGGDDDEAASRNEVSDVKTDGTRSRPTTQKQKSHLYPVHKAMLLRSEFFTTMFKSSFREAQAADRLHIISIAYAPDVLEAVLRFMYTDKADLRLPLALEVLYAADFLMIDRLKHKAAGIIYTHGNEIVRRGSRGETDSDNKDNDDNDNDNDIYDIIHASWWMDIQRLEEFGAKYLAYRLEHHIDRPAFAELILESANRIQDRQETDTIELLDDIRHYLEERFNLGFEETGMDVMHEDASAAEDDQENKEKKESVNVEQHTKATAIKASSTEYMTVEGEPATDVFTRDAKNYRILNEKLDALLERLGLEA